MPEELLEGEDVAAVAQVENGKGVAEAVGVAVGDAGAFGDALDDVADGETVERFFVMGGNEGGIVVFDGAAGGVGPDGTAGAVAEPDDAGA